MITPAQIAALAPDCDAEVLAPALAAAADQFHINTARRLAHWLGQLSVESGGFTHMVESLSYSAPRLVAVWPARFPTLGAATPYARNPEKLANKVYGDRMGNTQPGDGWRYIGRGFTQLTGRDNYATYGARIGVDLVGHPELAAEPITASLIAGAFWEAHGCNSKADADDIEGITRAINGGVVGLEERNTAVAKAKRIFGIQQA